MSSEVERVRLVLEDSDATDFPSSRASNVRTLLIQNFLVVTPSQPTRPLPHTLAAWTENRLRPDSTASATPQPATGANASRRPA